MSQADVMDALGTWFGGTLQTDPDGGARRYAGGPVAGLNMFYTGFPSKFPGSYFFEGQPPGTKAGSIAIIALGEPQEERLSFGGPGAWWRVAHPVVMHIYHKSNAAHAEDALASLRAVQDAIRDRLRADTTLGGRVFSAGEHDAVIGGAIGTGHKWKTTTPASANGTTEVRSDWSLTVVEHIQA